MPMVNPSVARQMRDGQTEHRFDLRVFRQLPHLFTVIEALVFVAWDAVAPVQDGIRPLRRGEAEPSQFASRSGYRAGNSRKYPRVFASKQPTSRMLSWGPSTFSIIDATYRNRAAGSLVLRPPENRRLL